VFVLCFASWFGDIVVSCVWFCDTFTGAIDKYSGFEDLCGSGRMSVIPYVHGRTKLYCA
jgi:hypothetical protein